MIPLVHNNQQRKKVITTIPAKAIATSIPGYKPNNYERETIITFDETPENAVVLTYNPAFIRKLDALTETRPGEVSCCRAESINGVQLREYRIPKRWIKVNPSRILTEEERERYAERGRINRQNQILAQKSGL